VSGAVLIRGGGARRIEFELGRNGCPGQVPSRITVHRVLVRHGLVEVVPRRRRRQDYRRWQREVPMELWQLDIVDGVKLADGSETKVVPGVDDHSRFCVIATVVRRATGRAVCLAFVEALQRFGIPDEVLTDNGKQFTGRFHQPRPAEVMFERICRENAMVARNTKPRTPTTPSTSTPPTPPGASTTATSCYSRCPAPPANLSPDSRSANPNQTDATDPTP
jgi:transposase InsO family protein